MHHFISSVSLIEIIKEEEYQNKPHLENLKAKKKLLLFLAISVHNFIKC